MVCTRMLLPAVIKLLSINHYYSFHGEYKFMRLHLCGTSHYLKYTVESECLQLYRNVLCTAIC